ncbi:MAG: hypothetical protein ABUL64_01660 [Singulisphaera sp.]
MIGLLRVVGGPMFCAGFVQIFMRGLEQLGDRFSVGVERLQLGEVLRVGRVRLVTFFRGGVGRQAANLVRQGNPLLLQRRADRIDGGGMELSTKTEEESGANYDEKQSAERRMMEISHEV